MRIAYEPLEGKLDTIDDDKRDQLGEILNLDFSDMKQKFTTDKEMIGWTPEAFDAAEVLYKNFLYLNLKYGGEGQLPPSRDVDDFWHGHILDTTRYANDCDRIFGNMLHHNPYFGIASKTDAKALNTSFERVQDLHAQEFGAPLYEVRDI